MIAVPHHSIETLRTRFAIEPMPMMRRETLSALIARGDEGVVSFLIGLLDGASPSMQADYLEGLCRFDDPETIDGARPFLFDPHPNLRRLAVIILWRFVDERHGLMSTVHDLFPTMKEEDYRHLPIPNRASYLVGIRTVGDIRLQTAVPALQKGLAWSDPSVRLECACSLLNLGRRDGIDEIRTRLAAKDEEARRRIEHLGVDNRAFFG